MKTMPCYIAEDAPKQTIKEPCEQVSKKHLGQLHVQCIKDGGNEFRAENQILDLIKNCDHTAKIECQTDEEIEACCKSKQDKNKNKNSLNQNNCPGGSEQNEVNSSMKNL